MDYRELEPRVHLWSARAISGTDGHHTHNMPSGQIPDVGIEPQMRGPLREKNLAVTDQHTCHAPGHWSMSFASVIQGMLGGFETHSALAHTSCLHRSSKDASRNGEDTIIEMKAMKDAGPVDSCSPLGTGSRSP